MSPAMPRVPQGSASRRCSESTVVQGRVALVTGASRGLGAAIAQALACAGHRVLVGYRESKDQAERVAAALVGTGHRTIQIVVDDSPQVLAAKESVQQREGRLDVLVNNAGTTRFVPHDQLDELTDDLFDRIMAVNVRGAFACTRAFRSLLQASSHGLVVNVSSVAAQTAFGSNVAYCASKAALENMTRSLARALAPSIRVVAVAPGLVDTDFTKSWDPQVRQKQIDATPLRRLVSPEEVAAAVICLTNSLTGMTGATLAVDGGRPLG